MTGGRGTSATRWCRPASTSAGPQPRAARSPPNGSARRSRAIADTHRGESVLVFTDGAVMSLAIARLSVNVGDHLAGAPNLPRCAVAQVEVDSDGWRLVSWPGLLEQA